MIPSGNDALNLSYAKSINKAIKFIDEHLEDELSLEKVANAACYSAFHFHRIFVAATQETLHAYITRRRIEKSASVLMRSREVTIAALAFRYGFNSNAAFTRAFKKYYGVSPSDFREKCADRFSKISKTDSKNGEKAVFFENYICHMDQYLNWIENNADVEVKEMPHLHLAYIPHIGKAHLAGTFNRLMQWARPLGLLDQHPVRMVNVYHDSFKITAPDKVRMSAGIIVNQLLKPGGEVGLSTIEKGKFVVGHLELDAADFEKAWNGMFMWLHAKGYQKAEGDCFEIYYNDPKQHPQNKFIIDLCIPIR